MRSPRSSRGIVHVAALLAVALLTLAGVRSNVMRAAELAGGSAPVCGMAMTLHADGEKAPGKAHASCEFCAAAAHAPVLYEASPAVAPTRIAWIVWRPFQTRGARAPPAVAARARGPPEPTLIA